jgi:hypothetical protein
MSAHNGVVDSLSDGLTPAALLIAAIQPWADALPSVPL